MYFSRSAPDSSACVLQYPLRAPDRPYDVASAVSVRYKPTSKKLEIELPPDPRERNRDPDASSTLRGGGGVAATRVLVSQDTPGHEGYCVAAMRDGVLRVVPIDRAFQMRPGTAHLDAADERARRLRERDREGGQYGQHGHHLNHGASVGTHAAHLYEPAGPGFDPAGTAADPGESSERGAPGSAAGLLVPKRETAGVEPEASVGPGGGPGGSSTKLMPLQVQVRRRETERQTEMRLHSHAYLKQLEEDERWITLDAAFHHGAPGVRGGEEEEEGGGKDAEKKRRAAAEEASRRVFSPIPGKGSPIPGDGAESSRARRGERGKGSGTGTGSARGHVSPSDGLFPRGPSAGSAVAPGAYLDALCPVSASRLADEKGDDRRGGVGGGDKSGVVGAGQENARGNEGGGGSLGGGGGEASRARASAGSSAAHPAAVSGHPRPSSSSQGGPVGPLSQAQLDGLPLDRRVHALFARGQRGHMRFARVAHFAPPGTPPEETVAALRHVAHCVRGTWVAKSALRCGGDARRERARDAVLLRFTRAATVRESELFGGGGTEAREARPHPHPPGEASWESLARDALSELATKHSAAAGDATTIPGADPRGDVVWTFADEDSGFAARYPALCASEHERWQALAPWLEADATSFGSLEPPPPPPGVSGELAARARALALPDLRTLGVVRLSSIRARLERSGDAGLAALANVREPELMGALGADAASVDGAVCLRATGDPKSDPFRGFLIEMLRARGRVVRRTEVMEGAAAALGAPPSNAVYMRCLGELCVSRGSTWVMKTGA